MLSRDAREGTAFLPSRRPDLRDDLRENGASLRDVLFRPGVLVGIDDVLVEQEQAESVQERSLAETGVSTFRYDLLRSFVGPRSV